MGKSTLIAIALAVLAAACGGGSGNTGHDGGAGQGGGTGGGAAGRGGAGGSGGSAAGGTGGTCGCTSGCCRSDSSCGVVVGNSLGPCVKIVTGTPDDNCPIWVGGEINLGGCCLPDGTCGLTIGGNMCFAGSEVGQPPQACP